MDIFQSRYYHINVTLLSLIGLWPYQKLKSWQLFQQIMCQISIFTVMMSQAIKLFEIWGNLDIMIECLTPMGVQLGALIKSINSIVQRKKMIKILETIKRDWSNLQNENEREILMEHAEEGRKLTIIYTGELITLLNDQSYSNNYFPIAFLGAALIFYLAIPLLPRLLNIIVPLNESRAPVYLYQTQYYVDPEEYFVWILLHTYSGTIVTVTSVIAADSMFACSIMHICGILAVIGKRLENLTTKRFDTSIGVYNKSTDDNDDKYHKEIVFCINQHYKVTEVAKLIENTYSISYLLLFGICMVVLSLSAVQLLIKFGEVEEMVRLIEFNVAQINHLLFNTWPCQKLIDQGEKFRESLYASEWYSLSEKSKHLLRFTMMRTVEPQKITAGKIYVMSIENFGVVMQTSMSYFTVFASVR